MCWAGDARLDVLCRLGFGISEGVRLSVCAVAANVGWGDGMERKIVQSVAAALWFLLDLWVLPALGLE